MEDETRAGYGVQNRTISETAANVAKLKRKKERAEKFAELRKEKFQEESQRLIRMFEAAEITSMTAHGFTFFIEDRETVRVPQSIEDKQALFRFLNDKGIFMQYATVHSQSLQSLYKTYAEEALKEGNLQFRLPGIGEPSTVTTLKLRKK